MEEEENYTEVEVETKDPGKVDKKELFARIMVVLLIAAMLLLGMIALNLQNEYNVLVQEMNTIRDSCLMWK